MSGHQCDEIVYFGICKQCWSQATFDKGSNAEESHFVRSDKVMDMSDAFDPDIQNTAYEYFL